MDYGPRGNNALSSMSKVGGWGSLTKSVIAQSIKDNVLLVSRFHLQHGQV